MGGGGSTFSWFTAVQTFGIITSFLLATYATFRNARATRLANYMRLTENHRDIWRMTLDKDGGLDRVARRDPSLAKEKLTREEALFLTFLFIHITNSYELQKSNYMIKIKLGYDIGEMMKAPLIARFWEENKRYHNDDFVKFIDAFSPNGDREVS